MARATQSVDAIIKEAMEGAMARLAPVIAKAIAETAAAEIEKHLIVGSPGKKSRVVAARTRSRAVELTKWVADNRARRVPTFVIELTGGVDTKKKIVARYGENVTFEKGKPAPKPKGDSVKEGAEKGKGSK
jgi:hypothetical protein